MENKAQTTTPETVLASDVVQGASGSPPADSGLTVGAIMTSDIITVDMDVSLIQIQQIFEEHGFHHLLVMDEDKLVGVISDRDVLLAVSPYLNTLSAQRRDERTLHKRAHQIMSRRLITASKDTSVDAAVKLLLKYDIGCLPVVSSIPSVSKTNSTHMQLVESSYTIEGIVTWRDILRYYLKA